MDILAALRRPEGKTLEFKRDLSSPEGLLRTVVAVGEQRDGARLLADWPGHRRVLAGR